MGRVAWDDHGIRDDPDMIENKMVVVPLWHNRPHYGLDWHYIRGIYRHNSPDKSRLCHIYPIADQDIDRHGVLRRSDDI